MEGNKIYLWVSGEGWKAFELSTAAPELEKRGIEIGDRAYIGDEAHIGDRAHIGGEAYIGGEATIGDGAYIGGEATIGDGANIGDEAHIGDRATIGDRAYIGDRATIGDRAHIGAGARPTTIYITGSRFPISYWGEDRVDIGCKSRNIEEWLTDSLDIAKAHGFTPEQTEEYHAYVKCSIKAIHDSQANKRLAKPETTVQNRKNS